MAEAAEEATGAARGEAEGALQALQAARLEEKRLGAEVAAGERQQAEAAERLDAAKGALLRQREGETKLRSQLLGEGAAAQEAHKERQLELEQWRAERQQAELCQAQQRRVLRAVLVEELDATEAALAEALEFGRGGGGGGGGELEMEMEVEMEMEMEVDEPAAALWHPPTVSGLRRLDLAPAEAEAAALQPSPKSSPSSHPAGAAASPPPSSPQPPAAALQQSSSIGEHLESLEEESPPPPPPPPPPSVGAAKGYGGARTFSRPSLAARFSMGAALAPPPSWPGQAALPAAAAPPLASDGAPSALAQSSAPAANASASAADGVVGEAAAAQFGEAGRKAKLASTRDRLQRMSLQRASLGGAMMPPAQKPEARLTRARAAAASLDPLHEP